MGGELFDFGGGLEEVESVTQPLDDGAGDEGASFEGEGHLAVEFPGGGGEHSVFAEDGFFAGVHEQEGAGAVGAFGLSDVEAGLSEECGLLVAGDATDGGAVGESGDVFDAAEFGGVFGDLGQQGRWDAEEAEHVVVPGA